MNDAEYQRLLEASWRRALTPAEEARLQAWLAAHPARQAAWQDEAALNRLLRRLPDAPLPSNFTARVLQAVAAEERHAAREPTPSRWFERLRGLLPKLAPASLLGALLVAAVFQYQAGQRFQAARAVATVSTVAAALPAPEVFEDFDAIRSLPTPGTPSDEELLVVLQR
jgi:anti-sigma factor RsiW